MTALRTAEAIAAQPPGAEHQHDLADITDAGALAALDVVGTAEIAGGAYASQSDAVAGADNTKIMTALRTAEAIAAQAAAPQHQHDLADITDAGALAGLDAIRPTEIDSSAYATQSDAVEGLDGTRIMTAGRTAEAIAAQAAAPQHQHDLADIADAGALAALNVVGLAEIAAAAFASQSEAVAGTDNTKIMTALRTAAAIAAQPAGEHQHNLADITDAGALAALDKVGAAEIDAAAFASQAEAVAGSSETKIMTALRTAEAIAAQAATPEHQHDLADIADAGALAALNVVGIAEIAAAAFASQSEAVAGTDNTKIMTALRTAEAIAAQPPGAEHQHDLADITDAGALAALDVVGTAEIAAAAYATQSDAVAGTDNTKIMTALRTAEAIAAEAAAPQHQHDLADIADAGALAGLDAIGPTEIDPSAYATQIDAAEGLDGTRIMTALRTAEAIAIKAAPHDHQHDLADIADAGALAALNAVGTAEIAAAAFASQSEAVAGTHNAKLMTPLRTAAAIAAQPPAAHQHTLAHISDAGALAALDTVTLAEVADAGALASLDEVDTAEIADEAVTYDKIAAASKRAVTATPTEGIFVLDDGNSGRAFRADEALEFEIAEDVSAGSGWELIGRSTGVTVAIEGDSGNIVLNGSNVDEVTLANGYYARLQVDANTGSAPDVSASGGFAGAESTALGDVDMAGFALKNAAGRQASNVSVGTGTHTVNLDDGDLHQITATGNFTLAFAFPNAMGVFDIRIRAINWGAHTITLTAVDYWAGGAPTFTASGRDDLLFSRDGNGEVTGYVLGQDIS
jgi:hypothetical protein